MSLDGLSFSDPLRHAAESFIGRIRRGEQPSFSEYVRRFPDQEVRIREYFPQLEEAERSRMAKSPIGEQAPPTVKPDPHAHAIGDYLIVREVGRGGMGIVYEAVQASLGRQVALKVLPAGPYNRGPFLERFQREARSAARLHHTNIVPVFGVGEVNGIHFYAMQFIDGLGLDSVLKEIRRRRGVQPTDADNLVVTVDLNRTRDEASELHVQDFELGPKRVLPTQLDLDASTLGPIGQGRELVELGEVAGARYFRSVARLGVQAAEALAYAHSQGVLHRDIKPSNLLLDRHGTLWITDFGLAKAEGEDVTGTGDIVGTLRYMAPERFRAESDARSDVYALGMTLYEMLALRPAFDDNDRLRLVERIKNDRAKRLRTLDRSVPKDLETIILKSIQKETAIRYASAGEMADDLRRFLADRPIKARRASLFEELRRWCRRNPELAILTSIVVLLIVGLVVVIARANWQLRFDRDEALSQKKFAEAMKKYADDRLWVSQLTTAQLRRSARKLGQRFEALNALADARRIKPDPGLITQAVASLALPDLQISREWEGWPAGSSAVDLDAEQLRYARSDLEGNVSVRWAWENSEIVRFPGHGGPGQPLFSRVGGYLAIRHERDGRLIVWRLSDESHAAVLDDPNNVPDAVDFGFDDKAIVHGRIDGQICIRELPSGQLQRQFDVGDAPSALALRPDGKQIAVAVGDLVLFIDSFTGAETDRLEMGARVERLAWKHDGKRLAIGTNDGHISLIARGKPAIILEGHKGGTCRFAFSHSGQLLASNGPDRTLRLWDTGTGRQLFATPSAMTQPRFSKDDRYLAPEIDGNKILVLEIAHGREYRTLVRHAGKSKLVFRDGSVSPDGKLLAMASNDGASIWDIQSGEELAQLPLGDSVGALFLSTGNLLTSGSRGVFEWPISTSANPVERVIGPPRIVAGMASERLAGNRNADMLAVATRAQGALVLELDRPTIANVLMSHENASFVAVSPDGTRLATGTESGSRVRVWDAPTNRLLAELPIPGGSDVQFSPNGRWLATNSANAGIQLWAVGNWKAGPKFPASARSRIAFSPDGSIVAVESGQGSVYLYDAESGKRLVEIEDPEHDRADWMQFSPDGSRLIIASNDGQCIHVWDLAMMRSTLAVMRLDWDAATVPFAPATDPIEEIKVLGDDMLDPQMQARWAVAMSTLGSMSHRNDADAFCRRGVAFMELGQEELGLADFTRALTLKPDHSESSFLRGMELFRRRHFEAALDDFTKAMNRPMLSDAARWMRGKALLQLDRVEEMMAEVNRLLDYYPNDPQLFYQRALGEAYREHYPQAMADLELALKHGPGHDAALNNLAWILVTGPESMRDPDRALGLVQRAVKTAPQKGTYQNTLGVAYYRLGRYREAVAALEKSIVAGKGQADGYNQMFLSMCHAKLGNHNKAMESFDKALDWRRKTRMTPHELSELEKFRAEAETVIHRKQT